MNTNTAFFSECSESNSVTEITRITPEETVSDPSPGINNTTIQQVFSHKHQDVTIGHLLSWNAFVRGDEYTDCFLLFLQFNQCNVYTPSLYFLLYLAANTTRDAKPLHGSSCDMTADVLVLNINIL